jgi:hypothetical protein
MITDILIWKLRKIFCTENIEKPKKKVRYTVLVKPETYDVEIRLYDNKKKDTIISRYYLREQYFNDPEHYENTSFPSYDKVSRSSPSHNTNDTEFEKKITSAIQRIQLIADNLNDDTNIYISRDEIRDIEKQAVLDTVERAKKRAT